MVFWIEEDRLLIVYCIRLYKFIIIVAVIMGHKGRSRRLIERRDAQIASRYYYWTEEQRLRFDDAIRQLSENEFFLSESRIMQILKRQAKSNHSIMLKAPKCPKLTAVQLKLFKDNETK